jgi:uncharacterized protein involved in exopolysaccharide biosynthesis
MINRPDPHLLDLFTLFAKYKGLFISIVLVFGLGFFVITFLMPFSYGGLTTLIPPDKQSSGNQLLSFLSGSSALDLMKGMENPALDMFKNVLDSRTISEEIALDPQVRKYFSSWDTSVAGIATKVQECLTSEPLRNQMFNVQVEVKTHWLPSGEEKEAARKLVPHLAKLFVAHLDVYNRERLMTTARNTRIFVEKEYNTRLTQLDSAYAHLQMFQQEHKTISLPEQLSAEVTSAAMLASEEQQLEIELGAAERELSPNSARVQLLRQHLEEIKAQMKKYDEGGISDYVPALKDVPGLTRKLAGLTREVKMLETITAYLRQQLEQERISEQRDLPTITVLDTATLPLQKSSPKRSIMLIIGLFSGVVASVIVISWKKFISDVRSNPQEHKRYLTFIGYLRKK